MGAEKDYRNQVTRAVNIIRIVFKRFRVLNPFLSNSHSILQMLFLQTTSHLFITTTSLVQKTELKILFSKPAICYWNFVPQLLQSFVVRGNADVWSTPLNFVELIPNTL